MCWVMNVAASRRLRDSLIFRDHFVNGLLELNWSISFLHRAVSAIW
jgi:hypothetical protein